MTLVEALRKYPKKFTGQRIYLCAYSEVRDAVGKRAFEQVKRGMGADYLERLDFFQEWPELPDFADLVCFYVGRRVRFDGFCEMPEFRPKVEYDIQLCWNKDDISADDISGIAEVGPLNRRMVSGVKKLNASFRINARASLG